jgi:hypothetical protein
MPQQASKEDLGTVCELIVGEMRTGFAGVHQRQDIANGRLTKVEIEVGRHADRLNGLEGTDAPALTKRDMRLLIVVGGGIVAFLEVIMRMGPAIAKAFTP